MDNTNEKVEEDSTESVAKQLSTLKLSNEESSGNKENCQLDQKSQYKFNKLVTAGKAAVKEGDYSAALRLFERANIIHPTEKLQRRIKRLNDFLTAEDEDEEVDNDDDQDNHRNTLSSTIDIGKNCVLDRELYNKLYDYQRDGISWLWTHYMRKKGGILADDMGLGKTIQSIGLISAMLKVKTKAATIVVVPLSLIENWAAEFEKWAPQVRIGKFHGSNKQARNIIKEYIQSRGGVLLTTYGLTTTNSDELSKNRFGNCFVWDCIMLDEGHKIKNATKTSTNLRDIRCNCRFILTGTPVQNNLKELWSLLDYVCQGKLLGSKKTFQMHFETPIVRGREKCATHHERRLGNRMAESLQKLIAPYILRRTKDIMKCTEATPQEIEGDSEAPQPSCSETCPMFMRKNDFVIWICLSGIQCKIYEDFLTVDRVKDVMMASRSPLAELNVLKKICDHPRLLSTLACSELGLEEDADDDASEEYKNFARSLPAVRILLEESGKLQFLVDLLKNFKEDGHRCLVFSQSRKILDIIQNVIIEKGYKMLRIDGTVSKTGQRMELVDRFQNDSSYLCFLLTTQVGGVGLNLTSADRVVIFDPSWNPATDAQAVDRVYRIGQTQNVIIYRLITCGTVEEKIYRRQIFKYSIIHQTTGGFKDPFRYFTNQELYTMFKFDSPHESETQKQLEHMHASQRQTDERLNCHIYFLKRIAGVAGISDHDLMFTKEEASQLNVDKTSQEYIETRVQNAQKAIMTESDLIKSTGLGTALGITKKTVLDTPAIGSFPNTTKNNRHTGTSNFCLPDSELFIPCKNDKKNQVIKNIPSVKRLTENNFREPIQEDNLEATAKQLANKLPETVGIGLTKSDKREVSEDLSKSLAAVKLDDNVRTQQDETRQTDNEGSPTTNIVDVATGSDISDEGYDEAGIETKSGCSLDLETSDASANSSSSVKHCSTVHNNDQPTDAISVSNRLAEEVLELHQSCDKALVSQSLTQETKGSSLDSSYDSTYGYLECNDSSSSNAVSADSLNSQSLRNDEDAVNHKSPAGDCRQYVNKGNLWSTLDNVCDGLQINNEDLDAQLKLLQVAEDIGLDIRSSNS